MNTLRGCVALLLCLSVSPMPLLAAGNQQAGSVNAVMPSATRNEKPTKVKDEVDWNDLLKTLQAGRLRANLTDGSILSLGSNSELKVVQHDTATQQTSLELAAGKLRSRVVKVTQPGGKFEVKTPNAVIGVVGTDFFVEYANNRTTVICYTGQVMVTPQGGAQVQKQSQGTQGSNGSIAVSAGQMVVIGLEVPPAGWSSQPTPLEAQQSSIEATTVTDFVPGAAAGAAAGIPWKALLIGLGVAGASAGIVVGTRRSGQSGNIRCSPNNPKCG